MVTTTTPIVSSFPLPSTTTGKNGTTTTTSRSVGDNASQSSDEGSHPNENHHPKASSSSSNANKQQQLHHSHSSGDLPPPVLVYHESARCIVFRDHLRRQSSANSNDTNNEMEQAAALATRSTTTTTTIEEEEAASTTGSVDPNDNDTTKQHQQPPSSSSPVVVEEEYKNELGHELSSDITNLFFPEHHPHQIDGDAVVIAGYQPNIVPLPHLELGPNDEFQPLLLEEVVADGRDRRPDETKTKKKWTIAEQEVVQLLQTQQAVVKTIKNSEWTAFLHRFQTSQCNRGNNFPNEHDDIPPHYGSGSDGTGNGNGNGNGEGDESSSETGANGSRCNFPFNSFVTSTSLLPPNGRKMRCFGAPAVYTTGVVFALPQKHCRIVVDKTTNKQQEFKEETEEEAMQRTHTWSWPSGYSAKTEFNIDSRGKLINGREEALVSLSTLRQYNEDYVTKEDYVVAGRVIKGGLKTVPYNEVFVRVGGLGRIVHEQDCATGEPRIDGTSTGRSFDHGVGLPIALFVRTNTFGHLISLFRTRARLSHVLGEKHIAGIPLLLLSPELGIRVVTESLQRDILQIAAKSLNPFQNPLLAHKTTIDDTSPIFMEAKLEELIDLDESIRHTLTPEECARLAGGFGATDESIAQLLKDAMLQDKKASADQQKETTATDGGGGKHKEESHKLQDIVNEGLAAAVRSGDYYTSRQLLILYSLVASEGHKMDQKKKEEDEEDHEGEGGGDGDDKNTNPKAYHKSKSLDSDAMLIKKQANDIAIRSDDLPPPPPPPPLDTDRLRSATNSDGLLAVLGAAQVLKAMRDGGAKKRTHECVLAVEEWVEHGEQSMAFRLASWRDQRAAQGDLQIAFDKDSSFMAFVSNKAISNRKSFAKQLRDAVSITDFTDVRFLQAIFEMANRMHSPCLRLELLQYVLGLDNRYSVAHVKRSIELAATCLSIAQ